MPNSQTFKAIYFPDYKNVNLRSKGLILAFGEKNKDLYNHVSDLESNEIRGLLGTDSYIELEQRAQQEGLPVNTYCLWYLRKNLSTKEETTTNKEEGEEKPISCFANNVIEGDCLEVMREIPSKSIDMILCDLPYGTTQNTWDSTIPLDLLWTQYERIIKDRGVIALIGQGLFTASLMLSNPKLFKYKITWVKSKPKSKNLSIKKWMFWRNCRLLSEKAVIGEGLMINFIKQANQAKIIALQPRPLSPLRS